MATLVHNLISTGDRRPPKSGGSWKDWWEKQTLRKFGKCSCTECNSNATVGAHVQKDHGGDEWYIVPLCDSCNKKKESFYVDSNNMEALH